MLCAASRSLLVTHANAPLSIEGRRRLVERCKTRPIAHVAAETGISRACASKWVNPYRRHGELGLHDLPSTPRRQPTATDAAVVARIEDLRRGQKWSASRIAFELQTQSVTIRRASRSVAAQCRGTVSRQLLALGLNHHKFIDPNGQSNREPRKITARRPGHMVHIDVKKVGRIPDGGGWRAHGRSSEQAKNVTRHKKKSQRGGYIYLHSTVDGFSRLAYTKALPDEKAATTIAFMHRARAWFATHGTIHIERIITDNEACYRANPFARALPGVTPPADHALHPATQRPDGALQPDHRRGIPLRPHLAI
jgi:transposase